LVARFGKWNALGFGSGSYLGSASGPAVATDLRALAWSTTGEGPARGGISFSFILLFLISWVFLLYLLVCRIGRPSPRYGIVGFIKRWGNNIGRPVVVSLVLVLLWMNYL